MPLIKSILIPMSSPTLKLSCVREKENPLAFVNYCLSVHELTRQYIYIHTVQSMKEFTSMELHILLKLGGGWIFDLQNHFSVETHCHTLIIEYTVDANWEDPSDANCMTNTVIRSIKCIHCNNHGMKINLPVLKIIKFIPHFKTTILDEYSTLSAPYIDVKMKILRNWNVYKI